MISLRLIIIYGLPALAVGFAARLIVLYAMKYATDVLLVAPFIIGLIFGLARIWDALTDPLVGYYSDKTQLAIGRRRSWVLAGAIPFGLFYAMTFGVPTSLGETATIVWLVVGILGFYTAMTVIAIPHLSWGTELSTNPAERSKFFGARHMAEIVGGIGALGTMALLIHSESQGVEYARSYILDVSIWVAVLAVAVVLLGGGLLKEEKVASDLAPRGSLMTAAKDVWANPHARLVLLVILIELIGGATMVAMAIYVAQYVMGAPQIAPIVITIYLVVQMLVVPLAVRSVGRFPKHTLWRYSMFATAGAFGGMFFLAFIESQTIQIAWNIAMVIIAGVAAAIGSTIGPTVLSDIIDYDEYMTHERKEGAYFAVWNFAGKAAGGVTLMLAGFVLSAIGFVPNEEQTQLVKVGMTSMLGLFPLFCYVAGALLFGRYQLTEDKVQSVRAELDQRKGAPAA